MAATTTLIVVRHGESSWNVERRLQGTSDIELSDVGRSQAHLLSTHLNGAFDVVVSSPLKRARETASIIANGAVDVVIDPGLREFSFGEWEGRTMDEIADDPVFQQWKNGEGGMPIARTGKTIAGLAAVNAQHLLDIARRHEGKRVVVVTHGAWLKAAVVGVLRGGCHMYHHFLLGNSSRTTFVLRNNQLVLLTLNELNHIPDTSTIYSY